MAEFVNEHRKETHWLENECALKNEECNDISKVEAKKRYLFIAAASFKLPFDRHSHWSFSDVVSQFTTKGSWLSVANERAGKLNEGNFKRMRKPD
jgi:hypothetical protein